MDSWLQLALNICAIVVPTAVQFIVIIWQNKRYNVKSANAIGVCDTFTNEIIPSYIEFSKIFDSDELSFLNEIHSDENSTQLLFPFEADSEKMKKCLDIDKSSFLLYEAMLLFNKMDLFSAKVLALNKSEQLYAKNMNRNAYVDIIQKYSGLYDLLLFEHENDYINLRHLYELWR